MNAGKVILLLIGSLILSNWGYAQTNVIDTICVNHSPSNLAVSNTPGSVYYWTIAGGKLISGNGTSDITVAWGATPGFYPVTVAEVTDRGCKGDTVLAYVYLREPKQALIQGPTEVCRGQEVVLKGKNGSDFIWNDGKHKTEVNFTVLNDTTVYQVALNGPCENDTFYHHIDVLPSPWAGMPPIGDTLNINTTLDLFFTGSDAKRIEWLINEWSIGTGHYQSYQFTRGGEYEITQIASSAACTDTIKSKIFIKDDFAVHIPNAFSPNGDGLNDKFIFKGVGMKNFTAEIYDRWGERIYIWSENTADGGWDGLYHGKPAKMDSYLYRIVVEDYDGVHHKYNGHITLVR